MVRFPDLLGQMAVTIQGHLALDLLEKNNVELIKGVDRASTTTISALRTAVKVAHHMFDRERRISDLSRACDYRRPTGLLFAEIVTSSSTQASKSAPKISDISPAPRVVAM